jgi:hypothetical protein
MAQDRIFRVWLPAYRGDAKPPAKTISSGATTERSGPFVFPQGGTLNTGIMLDVVLQDHAAGIVCVLVNPQAECTLLTHTEWDRIRSAIDNYMSTTSDEEIALSQFEISSRKEKELIDAGANLSCSFKHDKPGYVYIFRAGNMYKIGKSENPERRFTALRRAYPSPTEIVHTIQTDGMSSLENQLHNRFISRRCFGEWFELDEEDLAWLKTL